MSFKKWLRSAHTKKQSMRLRILDPIEFVKENLGSGYTIAIGINTYCQFPSLLGEK